MTGTQAGIWRARVKVLALALLLVLGIAPSAYAADGDLDPTFDNDGRVNTAFGSGLDDVANSVAVQSNGKIVTAGYHNVNSDNRDFALARYNEDGSLDTTFGNGGKVTTPFGSTDEANSVAIQSDGKIIAAGFTIGPLPGQPRQSLFALARYNTNGTLDNTFSGDGKATTDFFFEQFDTGDVARDVAIQADGKIVAAGYYGGLGAFAFARYNLDGSPDATFGDGGCANCTGVGTTVVDFGVNDIANSVAIQPDGRIVAAGTTATGFPSGSPSDFALARLNSNGSRDTSFDGDGKVITAFNTGIDRANGVAIQPDGRIVAAGEAFVSPNSDFALARYNADGSLDSSFDGDGKATTPFGSGSDLANSVAIQSDGGIVTAGRWDNDDGNTDFALARHNFDGSLDATFSGDGKTTTNFGSGNDGANGVAIQPNGRIVAAGYATAGLNLDFALARYEGRPPPNNDNFANARQLSGASVTVSGTNSGATREPGEPDHWSGGWLGENSVWYRWTAPSSGQVTLDTCASSFDSVLAVYTGGSIGSLTQVATDDDSCDTPNAAGSRLTFNATSGTTYRFAVAGYFAYSKGTFTLGLRDIRPPRVSGVAPANLATGIAPSTNVIAVFSEAMRPNLINRSTFTLRRAGTTANVAANVSYEPAARRATLNPNANLQAGATYIATVTPQARDLAGNSVDQDPSTAGAQAMIWRFTVRR